MFAFSTVLFSVGFFVVVVAVVVVSYSLNFSLHSFRAMNPDLSFGCRARRVVRDGGKSCLIWGSFPVGIQTRR